MPVWRNHKALSGSLAPGIFLLFTSLFGPFILRSVQRRLTSSRPSPLVENKPSLMTTDRLLEDSPEGSSSTNGEIHGSNIARSSANPREIADYCAFVAQLPPPTLTFAPSTENLTTVPATSAAIAAPTTTEGTTHQEVYKETLPSGDVRTVIEQHHDFGNGRRWRRKTVVYGGIEGSEKPSATTGPTS